MADAETSYPVKLSIDYPDRPLNRLSTFFRILAAIPILIIFLLLYNTYVQYPMCCQAEVPALVVRLESDAGPVRHSRFGLHIFAQG
jgi:hypothetical protein